jgi:hypothetical protein
MVDRNNRSEQHEEANGEPVGDLEEAEGAWVFYFIFD